VNIKTLGSTRLHVREMVVIDFRIIRVMIMLGKNKKRENHRKEKAN
jgi:hypothetical protein